MAFLTLTCVACHGVADEYCTKHFTATNQCAKSFRSTWLPMKPPKRNFSSVALALHKEIAYQAVALLYERFLMASSYTRSFCCSPASRACSNCLLATILCPGRLLCCCANVIMSLTKCPVSFAGRPGPAERHSTPKRAWSQAGAKEV